MAEGGVLGGAPRWSITPTGRLKLPKIGEVRVKWSRTLPVVPSSVTVLKDSAAGTSRALSSTPTRPADAARMPATDKAIGIDRGLTSHWWARTDRSSINVKQAAL
ncbi:hypothetical protein [Streptomyces sp. NPDC055400]